MNDDNNFEKLSFWQLLAKTTIEIPIIQRDYAQGRKSQQDIRNKFLKVLSDAFSKKPVELDFIYGREKDEGTQSHENRKTLYPLDGQQRLTTLFLLHWYIATKEKKMDKIVKDRLSKFTYEIRTSSREFCNELTTESIDFDKLLKSDVDEKGKSENNGLSKTIKNSAWFVASWETDSTISAMLVMLDAINDEFKYTTELWVKLIEEQNPPITFLYGNLEHFGLSDDLYIKMNARGKQLTSFENFKSQFEKYIEINNFECGNINVEEKFAHRIDTVWTDLFWQFRNNASYKVDNEIMKFIAGIAINYYAQEYSNSTMKKEIENRIIILVNNQNRVIPEDFKTQEAFKYLINCLNKYSFKKGNVYENAIIKPDVDLFGYCENTLFYDFIKYSGPKYKLRILFYAQTIYLLSNNYENKSFSIWIRVVRNIVENTSIEHPNDFNHVVNLINKLATGSSNIYRFLANNTISDEYAKEQVNEEIEKAKLIVENESNRQIIHEIEDTNFCRGKINFVLYCANYDIDICHDVSRFDGNSLKEIKKVLITYLNNDDITNDFRRALFTINDNNFYSYWKSWLYAVSADKWCIIKNVNDLKCNFTKKDCYGVYLKTLVRELCRENVDEVIEKFCKTEKIKQLPGWKQRIIKEKGLLDYSQFHYMAIATDQSTCWLIPYTRVANDKKGKNKLKEIK